MIQVREATPADADAIAAAHIEGWRAGYRHLLPDDYLDAPEFARQRIDRWRAWTWKEGLAGSQVYAAVLHGHVVGFGHCGAERMVPLCDQSGSEEGGGLQQDRGEVYGFYLHPTAWGSGAAAALMDRCHRHLHVAGFRQATLWVLRDNPRARGFYERAGWRVTGREMVFQVRGSATTPAIELPEVEYLIDLI